MPASMNRSTFTPSPFMGLPPRWNVGDMEPSYSEPISVLSAVSTNTTSSAVSPHARAIVLEAIFSNSDTSCDFVVTNDDGTGSFVTVATFTGISQLNADGLMVGLPQNINLLGRDIKVQVLNYAGTGTVTVNCKRLN